jgi:hypothetical protein
MGKAKVSMKGASFVGLDYRPPPFWLINNRCVPQQPGSTCVPVPPVPPPPPPNKKRKTTHTRTHTHLFELHQRIQLLNHVSSIFGGVLPPPPAPPQPGSRLQGFLLVHHHANPRALRPKQHGADVGVPTCRKQKPRRPIFLSGSWHAFPPSDPSSSGACSLNKDTLVSQPTATQHHVGAKGY